MVTRKNERAPAGRSDALERSARFRHSPGSLACACSANGETSMAGPRVGLFVTCLVDLIRPSVGFAAVKLLEDAGCIVDVPAPDLLRPAGLQFGRSRRHPRNRGTGDRGVRAVRLRRGAVRFLRRDAEGALSGAFRRRSQLAAARGCVRRQMLRADLVSGRRDGRHGESARSSTAPSPITTPAPACASSASRRSRARCSPPSRA